MAFIKFINVYHAIILPPPPLFACICAANGYFGYPIATRFSRVVINL